MLKYFNNSKICPKNKKLLFHNMVIIICCSFWRLFNPNYIEPIVKILKRNKLLIFFSYKVIEIDKFLIAIKLILLVEKCNLAIQIYTILNFNLDNAKKKRQIFDKNIVN